MPFTRLTLLFWHIYFTNTVSSALIIIFKAIHLPSRPFGPLEPDEP